MKAERRVMFILLSVLLVILLLTLLVLMFMERNTTIRSVAPPDLVAAQTPLTWEQALNSAIYKINKNDLPGAEQILLEAVRNNPSQHDLWMLLGAVFYRQEKYQQAEQTFRNVLRHQPNNAAAYNNLGETLIKLKRLNEAENAVKQTLNLAPANSAILLNAACLYAVMQNDRQALIFLREAMKRGVTAESVGAHPELVHLLERPDFMNYFFQHQNNKEQD